MCKNPALFQIRLMDSYTSRVKYDEVVPENAKLRNSLGETWKVKVVEENADDEKVYLFTKRWNCGTDLPKIWN
ncbi:hypothetical protein CDL12_15058 [Handroanthus impetiginosus]|uniref:Uncharacterized protein n=1 Tax=Handroanthus impetiginosus TaxID=429701 RepID=A0A2G9H497_9LAMI|nr:hypothetical protein CDL12_24992 [Handroanthus impetiginosus]PIN12331.1 hypothetical protein CDL12_15058 [Handroanthus impetiginosus]